MTFIFCPIIFLLRVLEYFYKDTRQPQNKTP